MNVSVTSSWIVLGGEWIFRSLQAQRVVYDPQELFSIFDKSVVVMDIPFLMDGAEPQVMREALLLTVRALLISIFLLFSPPLHLVDFNRVTSLQSVGVMRLII